MSAHYKSLTRRTTPDQVAIFPLSGTVLLPACDLPLNIFEPRYLNMIDDALKGDRLIGMVQKKTKKSDEVVKIGGLGRIFGLSASQRSKPPIAKRGLVLQILKPTPISIMPNKPPKRSLNPGAVTAGP